MILENKYIVVINPNMEGERIFYNGDVELEAFKKYRELDFKHKRIFRANVSMCKLFGHELIESYEVIERIA